MNRSASAPRPEPHDPEVHALLRLSLIDVNGAPIGQPWEVPAPLNRNTAAPLRLRVETVHLCGCSKVHQEQEIRAYY